MPCILVQAELVSPEVEQMKLAFRVVKGFTDADAIKIALQNYGILVRNLTMPDATAMRLSLESQGVPTTVVMDEQIPPLPEARFTRRMEFGEDALMVYDPIGRAVPVPWSQIALIAAGQVPQVDTVKFQAQETQIVVGGHLGVRTKTVTRTYHKLETNSQLLLDIFIAGGRMRFRIAAADFQYKPIFDLPKLEVPQRFAELVKRLVPKAPNAMVNRGVSQILADSPLPLPYASKATFLDESAWLLWWRAWKDAGGKIS